MTTERPDKDAEEQGAVAEQSPGTPDAASEGTGAARQTEPAEAATEAARQTEPAEGGTEAARQTEPAEAETETEAARQTEPAEGETEADAKDAGEGITADATDSHGEGGAADVGDDGVPDATPDPGAGHHEDHPRPSRRRSPALVASVAAAVLLVGGGGAYLAASASGGSGGRTGSGSDSGAKGGAVTPPPLALDGYGESGSGSNGIAPGEPNPFGTTYEVRGSLPGGPGSAPVYRADGEVTEAEVARLAKALGLDGTPVAQGQAWRVGPAKDPSGPSLVVDKQAPGTWTYHRYAAGTDDCRDVTVCHKDPANPAVDTVSEAAAKKAVAPVLKAAGQDGAKVNASQVMGAQRMVNADPVVGGLPTYGWTTALTVSAQGEVVGGNGQLKAPVKGDTYPVLSARETLDLMNSAPVADHRMGIGGCASPVPLKDRLEAPCGQGTSGATPEATATPARPTVTVEKAVFALAARPVAGRLALVPSWLFEVRAKGAQPFTVTHPAIDPRYLASGTPSGQPTPSSTSAPDTRDVKVEGYIADGRTLTVSFTGGVCGDYAATASESSEKVTVTVTETPYKNRVCIMIAKEMVRTVQLKEPLGDRKVVGSDGTEIPQAKPGARLPRTSAGVR